MRPTLRRAHRADFATGTRPIRPSRRTRYRKYTEPAQFSVDLEFRAIPKNADTAARLPAICAYSREFPLDL